MSKANNIKSQVLEIVKELNAAPDVVSNSITVSSIKLNGGHKIFEVTLFDDEEDFDQCLDQILNTLHPIDAAVKELDGIIEITVVDQ